MSLPVSISAMNEPSDWAKLLAKYPDLRFEKLPALVGACGVTLIYNMG